MLLHEIYQVYQLYCQVFILICQVVIHCCYGMLQEVQLSLLLERALALLTHRILMFHQVPNNLCFEKFGAEMWHELITKHQVHDLSL